MCKARGCRLSISIKFDKVATDLKNFMCLPDYSAASFIRLLSTPNEIVGIY